MKKITAVITATIISVTAFALSLTGCGVTNNVTNNDEKAENSDAEKLSIVTTIFPEYDWVKEILGDNAENTDLTMLLDSGVDLHSYQPTADDILKISSCDMFIYVGGESDEWVEDVLNQATNENTAVINLLDVLSDSIKEEEVKEGMEAEEDGEEETEYDEHIWLSLKNAETICSYISDKLCEIDSDNADNYKENADSYISELKALDGEYQAAVDSGSKNTLVFADRFPFRYMVDDYGLDYYAAFVGCSAESEASFETVKFLANKVDELGLNTVLTIENPSHKIAETVVENTENKNQQILAMDSMQSTTSGDAESGTTYLSVMQNNLEVLKTALA